MSEIERLLAHYGCDRYCFNNNDCNNCWYKQHVQYELDRMKMQHHDCKTETKIPLIW